MKVDFLPSLHVVLRSFAVGHKILCHHYGKFVENGKCYKSTCICQKMSSIQSMIHVKNLWRKYDIKYEYADFSIVVVV